MVQNNAPHGKEKPVPSHDTGHGAAFPPASGEAGQEHGMWGGRAEEGGTAMGHRACSGATSFVEERCRQGTPTLPELAVWMAFLNFMFSRKEIKKGHAWRSDKMKPGKILEAVMIIVLKGSKGNKAKSRVNRTLKKCTSLCSSLSEAGRGDLYGQGS